MVGAMGLPWRGWMGVVSAAKGHSTLVGWATIMTFANVALIVLLMRASLGTSRNAPLQLQAPVLIPDTCVESAYEVTGPNSAWHTMKQYPPPAQCRVQGYVLERIEPEYNFRRGWTLGYTSTPEDRTHLLPYLRPIQDRSMATKKRRVLLGLGAGKWENILWFLRHYPLDFTEVHVFEEKKGHFKKPPNSGVPKQYETVLDKLTGQSQVEGAGKLAVPDWMLDRVRLYYGFIRNNDSDATQTSIRTMNISKVLHKNLKLTKDDAVVVLMDIEHAEWEVLPVWMEDPDMPQIIDELFLEVHYQHPSMEYFQWTQGHTREEATRLYLQLRYKGFFVHAWP